MMRDDDTLNTIHRRFDGVETEVRLRGEMAARRLVALIGAEFARQLAAHQEHLDLRLDLILEGQQVFVRRDELAELLER